MIDSTPTAATTDTGTSDTESDGSSSDESPDTQPDTATENASAAVNQSSGSSTAVEVRAESALHTDKGTTTIAEGVVAKIVGIATREVAGIHSMGSGAGRAMGAVKDLLPGSSSSVTEGVVVEVGSTQAAADLTIVTEYGVAIQDVAQAVRDNIIRRVQEMTGLEVVEVNVAVTDVNVPMEGGTTSTVAAGPAPSGGQTRVQ